MLFLYNLNMKKFLICLLICVALLFTQVSLGTSDIAYAASNYSIIVNKAYKLLFLYKDESLYKIFPVCIGAHTTDKETPTGSYKIINRTYDPVWYFEGKVYQPYKVDKNNGLGYVWMGWNLPSYGLHGTNEPFSIGFANSHGCVRMENKDALYIAKTIPLQTPVEVIEGKDDNIAKHLETINVLYSVSTVLGGTD